MVLARRRCYVEESTEPESSSYGGEEGTHPASLACTQAREVGKPPGRRGPVTQDKRSKPPGKRSGASRAMGEQRGVAGGQVNASVTRILPVKRLGHRPQARLAGAKPRKERR